MNVVNECATTGNELLTITGSSFASPISVLVNGIVCPVLSVTNATTIICTLASGTGIGLPLVVFASSQLSVTYTGAVSYALPSITSIVSNDCTSVSLLQLTNCNRTGGELVLIGAHFGASLPSVFIGQSLCIVDSSLYNSSTQSTIKCTLPSGSSTDIIVRLVQYNGEYTTDLASISYAQCKAGQYDDGSTTCQTCPAGRFSSSISQVHW
jgi:hypothetical protein